VSYTKVDARCDKLALVQNLGAIKTVTYVVFYTKLDVRCDKLALVVMKTARLLRLLCVARRVDQYSEYGAAHRPAGDRRLS